MEGGITWFVTFPLGTENIRVGDGCLECKLVHPGFNKGARKTPGSNETWWL